MGLGADLDDRKDLSRISIWFPDRPGRTEFQLRYTGHMDIKQRYINSSGRIES